MGFSSEGNLILILLWHHFSLILLMLFGEEVYGTSAFSMSGFEKLSWKDSIPFYGNTVLRVSFKVD